jgi:hypothetical protein
MHTLRKLPTIRPRRANRNIKIISTGVYCGRIIGSKSIVRWYCCRAQPRSSLGVPLSCHGESRFIGTKQSRCGREIVPILDRLPAQEGIGRGVNDIPYIGGIALARTADCDYVPRCP